MSKDGSGRILRIAEAAEVVVWNLFSSGKSERMLTPRFCVVGVEVVPYVVIAHEPLGT
jgi:hypothetical protein